MTSRSVRTSFSNFFNAHSCSLQCNLSKSLRRRIRFKRRAFDTNLLVFSASLRLSRSLLCVHVFVVLRRCTFSFLVGSFPSMFSHHTELKCLFIHVTGFRIHFLPRSLPRSSLSGLCSVAKSSLFPFSPSFDRGSDSFRSLLGRKVHSCILSQYEVGSA
jgi:hypothetical protein